ncbi:MAG: DUF4230 domain-containing protein [Prevotella sp.]|nr:DUF4230 domain-containing protein [Prevotella sp.]
MRNSLCLLTLLALLCIACSGGAEKPKEAARYESIDTLPMLIMQIQKCSKLYTAEYHIHKIVTHDDVVRLQGNILQHDFNLRMPLSDRKIAIPIDATLKAYIDFADFSERNIERNGKKITIVLPDPKVAMTSSKVDQRNIREYVALTRAHFSDAEMANYEQQGREAILQSIPELGIIETAQANAASTIIPMLMQMGWREQDITIVFRKDFGARDIRSLLDNSTIEQ